MRKTLIYLVGIYTLFVISSFVIQSFDFITLINTFTLDPNRPPLQGSMLGMVTIIFRNFLTGPLIWLTAFSLLLKNKRWALLVLIIALVTRAYWPLRAIYENHIFGNFENTIMFGINLTGVIAIAILVFILWRRGELLLPIEKST